MFEFDQNAEAETSPDTIKANESTVTSAFSTSGFNTKPGVNEGPMDGVIKPQEIKTVETQIKPV